MQSGYSSPLVSDSFRYALFLLTPYVGEYCDYLDTERFGAMPTNGEATAIYDVHNGVDYDTALVACVRRWKH